MRFRYLIPSGLGVACILSLGVLAQDPTPFTDESGIKFSMYSAPKDAVTPKGGFEFGIALPENLDRNEYIGRIVGSRPNGKGWTAISHTSSMLDSLILLAWVDENKNDKKEGKDKAGVRISWRYATNYSQPAIYLNPMSFTEYSHTINSTHFVLTYRCEGCFSWTFQGISGNQSIQGESILFGWAQGMDNPVEPGNDTATIKFHDNGFGVIVGIPGLAANPAYDTWVRKPPNSAGPQKTSTLDPKLAGTQTAWPTFPKISPVATPAPGGFNPSPQSVAPPLIGLSSPGLPKSSPRPLQPVSQTPPSMGSPKAGKATTGSGLTTTITSGWSDWSDKKDQKRQVHSSSELPKISPPLSLGQGDPKIPVPTSTASQPIPMPSDDLGAFPAMSGVPKMPPGNHGSQLGLPTPKRRRRLQTSLSLPKISPQPTPPLASGPPKIPIPTSSASTPVPRPSDDLGAFPHISGVPNKPPGTKQRVVRGR